MKKPFKVITVLAVIFFLLALSLTIIYVVSIKKHAGNIQPTAIDNIAKDNSTPNPSAIINDIVIESPRDTEISIKSTGYEIKGTNPPDVIAIELEITNNKNKQQIIPLNNFHKGDTKWSYKLNTNNTTLANGKNIITVIAYPKDKFIQEERIINMEKMENVNAIKIDWDGKLTEVKEDYKNDYGDFSIIYKTGTVAEGEYKGLALYLKNIITEGPGGPDFHHIIKKDNEEIDLEEVGIKIAGISNLPEKIAVPDKNYFLTLGLVSFRLFSDIEDKKILFKNDILGNVYSDERGCALIELPDHTATSYNFDIPFKLNKITFNNGEKNTEEYRYDDTERASHYCGPVCISLNYVDEKKLMPNTRLKIAGTADNKDLIYEIGDFNDESLKTFYDSYVNGFSGEYVKPADTEKRTFEEFMKLHPYLFWKDSFGRWVEFTNIRFISIPQVEMCKPVIYLYPEEKIKLRVEVSPIGGFTHANPPYDSGWNVEADPNGQITDLKTGKNYNYLYWEGVGLNYPVKDEGWVVEKEKLSEFFDQKLPILGLNAKETSDFKNYWLNRLKVMPYYQISFLSIKEVNYLAPIKFSPNALQTLIRIMMEAKGLNELRRISRQQLPETPTRKGFTAVEWGGMILN